MLEILKYSTSGFWVFLVCFSIIYIFVKLASILVQRFFRLLIILFRGFPPSHLDADGDFKPNKIN